MPSYKNDVYLAIGSFPDGMKIIVDASVDGQTLLESIKCMLWRSRNSEGKLTMIKMTLDPDTFGIS